MTLLEAILGENTQHLKTILKRYTTEELVTFTGNMMSHQEIITLCAAMVGFAEIASRTDEQTFNHLHARILSRALNGEPYQHVKGVQVA